RRARQRHLRLVRAHEIDGDPPPEIHARRPATAMGLIGLNVLEGIGGLAGAVMMFEHPHGTAAWPVSWLGRLPFHTFVVPGVVLVSVMGVAPLVVSYGLWRRPAWRWTRPLAGWSHEHW